ncbi:MAG: hypothetical protein WDZ52_01405 [Pseudohongiellaceae bacterium]
MAETDNNTPPSAKKILIATAVSLVIALLVLFGFVLPAEFGSDPLRTGQIFGLNVLGLDENPFEEQLEPHKIDSVEFILGPFESVEYKYLLDRDASMLFSWRADGELYYDMHAEPAGLGEEYAESFEQGNGASRMGSFHAPFTGIHGWFWENRTSQTITLQLYSAGFYINSTVFRDGGSYERALEAVSE